MYALSGHACGSENATIEVDANVGNAQGCHLEVINVLKVNRESHDPYTVRVTACVYKTERLEFADFYNAHVQLGSAVKFPDDEYFRHVLDNRAHTYSPQGDVLAYKGGDSTRLTVVRNFSKLIPRLIYYIQILVV